MPKPAEPPELPPVGTIRGPFVHLGQDGWARVHHIVTIEPSIGVSAPVCEISFNVTDPDTAGPLVVVAKCGAAEMLSVVIASMRQWERTAAEDREYGRLDALDRGK